MFERARVRSGEGRSEDGTDVRNAKNPASWSRGREQLAGTQDMLSPRGGASYGC
jgi:hypothetical protein